MLTRHHLLLLEQLLHGGLGLGRAQTIEASHHERGLGSCGVRPQQQGLGEQGAGVESGGELNHGLTNDRGH